MSTLLRAAACWGAIAALAGGCGYRAAYAPGPAERLHVKLVRSLVADAVTSDEVAAGVRDELALSGQLEPGDGFPRVEIEVLRGGEASEGVAAGASASAAPAARAMEVGVTARAWVVRSPGGAPERDTGDLRAEDVVAMDETAGAPDPAASMFHEADAARAAARRLGRKLARRLSGGGAASEDAPATLSAPPRSVLGSAPPP